MKEEFDDIKEEHNKPPLGWMLFFIGVIIWVVYYIVAYTPEISGWSHNKNFDEQMQAAAPAADVKAPEENPYDDDNAAVVAEGKEIYDSYCAACHGENMMEPAVGVDLKAELTYGDSDKDLFESIADGRPNGMPPFGQQLGADRTWKVVTYIDAARDED